MLPAASADIFNPLVPKAHNSECQTVLYPFANEASKSQLKPVFIFYTHGKNGLTWPNVGAAKANYFTHS